MTRVVDASAVVAALVDDGPDGAWAAEALTGHPLLAPEHLLVECANVLRRAAAGGQIDAAVASDAHDDLLLLRVDLVPYSLVARRCWELRDNVSSYDAAYVAVAEETGAPLVTLDRRLRAAPGPRCEFLLPDSR